MEKLKARPETAEKALEAAQEQFRIPVPSLYYKYADRCPQRHRERLKAIERVIGEGK